MTHKILISSILAFACLALLPSTVSANDVTTSSAEIGAIALRLNGEGVRVAPAAAPVMTLPSAGSGAPAGEAAPARLRTFSAADAAVKRPVTVRQFMPMFVGARTSVQGIIEIVIDETGAVQSAEMRVPTDTTYDRMAVAAAREWIFKPATLDGVPVKYVKSYQVNVKGR